MSKKDMGVFLKCLFSLQNALLATAEGFGGFFSNVSCSIMKPENHVVVNQ